MSVLAMDCVTVGSGVREVLGKVSFVDRQGTVLLDQYVKPTHLREDYRIFIKGITRQHLDNGKSFEQTQKIVFNLISYNVIVGYSLDKNLDAVRIDLPGCYRRDISQYGPFMKNGRPQSLKDLAKIYLNKIIHEEKQDTLENARIAMELYELVADEWH